MLNGILGTHDPNILKFGKKNGIFVVRPAYFYVRNGQVTLTTYLQHAVIEDTNSGTAEFDVVDPNASFEQVKVQKEKEAEKKRAPEAVDMPESAKRTKSCNSESEGI